jgi:hypothetical protein
MRKVVRCVALLAADSFDENRTDRFGDDALE